jgi:AraC-like DNA-binding protein
MSSEGGHGTGPSLAEVSEVIDSVGERRFFLDAIDGSLHPTWRGDAPVDGIDPDQLNREAGFGLSEGFSFLHHDPDWLNAGLHHLLLHSWRLQQGHQSRLQPVTLHPAVRKALRRVNDPGCLEESGRETARHCGVSPAYLSRMFHRQIGVPLTRYRNSVRLGRFWEAYRAGGSNNFLEAVYAAGFGSYPQFFRVFTEAYGKGPRELLRISP